MVCERVSRVGVVYMERVGLVGVLLLRAGER